MQYIHVLVIFPVLTTTLAQIVNHTSCGSKSPQSMNCKTVIHRVNGRRSVGFDLYLPTHPAPATGYPLLVWVHGGAWMRGSREDFPHKNINLATALLEQGYALATVDYRLSQEAQFPAQIQDVNAGITYLFDHACELGINRARIGVMGRSAGAHLASLVATSRAHNVPEFSVGALPCFNIQVVVNLFGPSDFIALRGNSGRVDHDSNDSAEAKLLGSPPLLRPDIAKWASPTTYVERTSPPFIILHGDADKVVSLSQSILLKSYLDLAGVRNELVVINSAGHGDPIFDSVDVVSKVIAFLKREFPVST